MEREFSNYSLHITIPISILVGRAQEIIATFPGNVRAIPVAGENFGQDPTVAKARLQSYAYCSISGVSQRWTDFIQMCTPW